MAEWPNGANRKGKGTGHPTIQENSISNKLIGLLFSSGMPEMVFRYYYDKERTHMHR